MEKKHVNLIAKTFLTFAVAFAIALAGKLPTQAASAPKTAPKNLKQTDAIENAFAMKWSAVSNVDGYVVYVSNSKNGSYTQLGAVEGTSAVVNQRALSTIKAGGSYWIKVTAAVVDGRNLLESPASKAVEMVTSPKAPTKLKHVSSTGNSIKVSWSASRANRYKVYHCKSTDVTYKSPRRTNQKSYTLKKLSKNREYDVKVTAGRTSSAGFTAWSSGVEKYRIPVKPSKVTGVQAMYPYTSNSYKPISKVRIGCKAIECADGYQFEVQSANGAKIKTTTTNGRGANIKDISSSKIKEKKFIRVRVRAYYKNSKGEKKPGTWSDWKYTCQQPKITKVQSTSAGLKITWDKVSGANRYAVYVSSKPNSGYKKVATPSSSKRSTTIKNLRSGRTYYFYVVGQKKVNGKYQSGDWGYYWYATYRK